jgi:RNA polymerase sigma factor (sigma-70 family)
MDHEPDRVPVDAAPAAGSRTLDPALIAALYHEHGAELKRFVLGVVRNADLADDVMQATFAKAIERGGRSRSLRPWLFRVALNEALAARRREAIHQRTCGRIASSWSGLDGRPEDGLIRDETVATIRQGLASLPPEQYRVVRARIYEDRTFAEIAREQGVPLGTVLTRMRLALARLRHALGTGETSR